MASPVSKRYGKIQSERKSPNKQNISLLERAWDAKSVQAGGTSVAEQAGPEFVHNKSGVQRSTNRSKTRASLKCSEKGEPFCPQVVKAGEIPEPKGKHDEIR
jgi:hypothetical protein